MESEIRDIIYVQQLGAHPFTFYRHFIQSEYVKPINLFPLIPKIKEIEPIQKTKEDLEKRRQESFRKIKDMVLLPKHREPDITNEITLPQKTTLKIKTLGGLIDTLIY